jgi:photosystem II stability/assembly factor-like uncharacterized protein
MKKNYILILISSLLFSASHAQWQKTNGPEGICVTSFFNEDSILLCGTYAQGVFRSYDNGNNWIISNQGLQNKWIDCFAKDSTYIYAGCFGEGVFRSSDNGYTWQPANTGIQNEAVYCLLKEGGNLFAGTVGNGVFLSTDQGNTWTDINGGALGSSFILAMVYSAPRLMVEADNYIFYSFDTGATWYVDQGTTQFYQINDFFQHGDTILAAAFSNLFRTTDGGATWSNPYQVNSSVVGFTEISDTVYAGTAFGVYYSIDWGVSWVQVPATGLRTGASDFIASGNNLIVGREEKGIAVSADRGFMWTNLPLSQFSRASTIDNSMIFANDSVFTGTHGNGFFVTVDHGNNWNKIGTSNQFDSLSNSIVSAVLHVQPGILFAGTGMYGLYRSTDNGTNWTHITAGLPQQTGTGYTSIKTLAQCGPNILAATTEGVYYSTDLGLTWHYTNLTGSGVLQSSGFAIRDSIACVGIIGFPLPTGVYRSTDYGITWFLVDPILDIDAMATGGNHTMYCGELFSSYRSYDDGLTWQGNGIGGAFTILAWDNYAFVGNNNGVLFSNNYGNSWTFMNQGMDPYPNNSVQGLTRDSIYVYAGTFRDAVWRRPLSDFGITTGIPENIQEAQTLIAPNPATAFIKITLPSYFKEKYFVTIFNSSGQRILSKEVHSTDKNNSLTVYVKDFSPGFYSVKIQCNDQVFNGNFIKTN